MPIKSSILETFIGGNRVKKDIAAALAAGGLSIEYVHTTNNPKVWGYFTKLSDQLQATLGETREVLVLVAEYDLLHASEIDNATRIIQAKGARLSRSVSIIITDDRRTGDKVREISDESGTLFVGFSLDRIRKCKPHGDQDFRALLQAQSYARDLYDLPGAVTKTQDFFGRRRLLERLRQEITSGTGHQGIFGLRKIGKTSLVNRLAQLVREDGRCFVAQIDLQRAAAIRPDSNYILWSIGQAIYDSHRHVRDVRGYRLFGQYGLFSDISHTDTVCELFDHDLNLLISQRRRKVAVFLDEIERILPPGATSAVQKSFVKVWRILRGLDQQFPGRLSFIISGTNPKCVEDSKVGEDDNPVYNYFTREYLKPLRREEAYDLLTTIGGRIGLQWDTPSLAASYAQTGGHPALLRALGSAAHNKNMNRHQATRVLEQDVRLLAQDLLIERSSLLAQLVSTLKDEYRDEYYLLTLLAEGKVHEFAEWARIVPGDVAHLVGYGICRDPHTTPSLCIDLLQTYLQRQLGSANRPARPSQYSNRLDPGDKVGDYTVLHSVGSPGGFATVYKAQEEGTEKFVALKVVRNGKLSTVQRELDILQTLNHPNIVRIIDAGSVQTGDPYIAMEYIEGPTLRNFCEASTRPSEHMLLKWSVALLEALERMHPRPAAVDDLRKRHDELDGDVAQAIFEAQHGVVHRDIKPANIILSTNRGPILIDFNLSVRAGAPVETVSATPHYLPPGFIIGNWTHEVDLYQLGVTLLQLAAGAEIGKATIADLKLTAAQLLSGRTFGLVDRLLAFQKPNGYRLTGDALRDARTALNLVSRNS
ncbi:serine/threonine protein kinase [Micromonospora haikouensis]|uniref:non-specific serine/threonine protein kinase n=1 Tax=Micromonospora haikouensis TaxID=686309 RepID=A0A1C4TW45_9ACTN|nr:serine/threonine-protein kinase [Micromonospora haikouensis]SCE63661.1 serine/threonine protein kinase [Micromonospora haikouensis]